MDRREHVLVVGAGGAIGGALARALRHRRPEARLTLADLDLATVERRAAELGRAVGLGVDLRAPGAARGLLSRAIDAHGPIDGLLNAAGVMEVARHPDLPWDQAHALLQIDLVAPLELMHALTGALVAERRPGFVVNVTSMAGRVPLPGCSFYGAAKAGLSMASEIARSELAPHGVRVLTVYPGPVRSALEQRARGQYAPSRLADRIPTGDPDALAARVLDALDRGRTRVVYPAPYHVAWWFQRLADAVALALGPSPRTLLPPTG